MPSAAKHSIAARSGSIASVSIAQAKSHFSSLINGVEKKRDAVTILRRGVPVAQIIPFPSNSQPTFLGSMTGTGRELGDIVSPYLDEWTIPGD